jgi:excisionase family DNA binding protein
MSDFSLMGRANAARSLDRGAVQSAASRGSADAVPPLLLTAEQVANLLGTSKRQVWRLESAGRIPKPVRLGGRLVRWRWTELVEFVEELGSQRREDFGRA